MGAEHRAASVESPPAAYPGLQRARTAVVHDWFQGFHGSERVVEAMITDVFAGSAHPPAVYTFHAARDLLPQHLDEAITSESRLARSRFFRQRGHDPGRWRWLLPYMPRYFERLSLEPYDLVVSSSHACAVNVRPREGAVHLCYCYTPMRYAWMPALESARVRGVKGIALAALRTRLRRIDLAASRRVDGYIAISEAVSDRIRRFYGRDSVVIHPPVDTSDFRPLSDREPAHFLWVHRFVPYKQPRAVMEAFRGLPLRLTMVGVGPLKDEIAASAPPNVRVRGWVSREELAELYGRAGGFIHVGEEDFGISMVEALAAGAPVLALERGGARDIIRNGIEGTTVSRPTVTELRDAIRHMSSRDWDPAALSERAAAFARPRFVERMQSYAEEMLARRT